MSEDRMPIVLVTGAARRIGAATARTLHGAGWNVVLHAHRSQDELQALVTDLNALRADSAHAVLAELQDADAIKRLAAEAHARWRRLDALVNNASSYYPTALGHITAAQIDELVGSNLRAPLLLTQACAALFGAQAAVVNIVDTQVPHPQPGYAPYFAAKAGLWSLTETLALELAPKVRVNAVAPGHMLWASSSEDRSELHRRELARIPLGRLGGADEVARAVRFLLSDAAAYITGAVLPVDGGLRLR